MSTTTRPQRPSHHEDASAADGLVAIRVAPDIVTPAIAFAAKESPGVANARDPLVAEALAGSHAHHR
jgi:hypothetical protein